MLTCDTFIDLHGLKPKLTLILHGFRHAILDSCALPESDLCTAGGRLRRETRHASKLVRAIIDLAEGESRRN
jgi:hypothetical protein